MSFRPLVFKFGGELLEDPARLATVVAAIAHTTKQGAPLVIVHGGGKEIDRALNAAGIAKHQVDGLRVTDEATLEIVVAVLAGAVNTRFVAALTGIGVKAVGLTGADDACGLAEPAPPHRTVDGRSVDLGCVGNPSGGSGVTLLTTLVDNGFVPVIASIGIGPDGQLLNVNADMLAGHLAGRLGAARLIIAGTTAGVLEAEGRTVPLLDAASIERLVSGGTATAGMIAKLHACKQAIAAGVGEVLIVDGRDESALEAAGAGTVPANATRIAGLKTCATSTRM
jgi:acetylglutamate kinase